MTALGIIIALIWVGLILKGSYRGHNSRWKRWW